MPRGQALRTIAVWLVLIAMFLTIYTSFGGGLGFSLSMFGGVIALVLLFFGVTVARNVREARRFQADNTEALAQSARGNHEAARATFSRWVEETHMARVVAVARHNLGWTLARMGKLDEAIEVATANEQHYLSQLEATVLAPTSAIDLALYHALAGHLDDAEAWLARAAERHDKLSLPSVPAMAAFARAALDCRAGRYADAAGALDERWSEYEAVLTGDTVRSLRLVRAFAKAAEGPRHAGVATIDIATLRPAFPDEYAMLTTTWPEMAGFLASNGLA